MRTRPILAGLLLGAAFLTTVATAEEVFVKARWIAPPAGVATNFATPMFRKEFAVSRQPVRAWLRIVGLGDFDARVNGRRVADTGMNQPWSQYEKTIYYREFDISGLLQDGSNCVGVTLGNSFWNNPDPPKGRYNKGGPQRKADEPFLLCAEIRWEVAQGGGSSIGTDETWRTVDGPVVFPISMQAKTLTRASSNPAGIVWDMTTTSGNDRAWPLCRPES